MDTEYNSEYLVPLRCTQIALWATSGIRGTLCEIPANQETRHPWRAEKSRNETRRSGEAAS
jgi:hypothetical protein